MKTLTLSAKKELVKELANKETIIKDFVKDIKNKANQEKNKKLKASWFSMADYLNTVLRLTKGQVDKGWMSEEQALVKYDEVIKNFNITKKAKEVNK